MSACPTVEKVEQAKRHQLSIDRPRNPPHHITQAGRVRNLAGVRLGQWRISQRRHSEYELAVCGPGKKAAKPNTNPQQHW